MKFAPHVLIATLLLAALGAAYEPPPSPYPVSPPAVTVPQYDAYPPPPPPVTVLPSVHHLPEVPACAAHEPQCAGECDSRPILLQALLKSCPWFKQIAAAGGIEIEVEACTSPARGQVVVIRGCQDQPCHQVCAFTVSAKGKCACGDACCCAKKDCKCGKACKCAESTASCPAEECAVAGKFGPACPCPGECAPCVTCPTEPCLPQGAVSWCEAPCYGVPVPGPPPFHPGMMEVLVENAVLKARLEFLEEKQELFESLVEATVENARLEAQLEQSEERLELVKETFEAGQANIALQVRVAELERQLKAISEGGPRTVSKPRPTRR